MIEITDDMMHEAVRILSSDHHAKARAAYEKMDRQKKIVLARLERESNDTSVRQRETFALTHPHYEAFCEQMEAVESLYFLAKDRRDSADAVVRAWQTLQANNRALERVR